MMTSSNIIVKIFRSFVLLILCWSGCVEGAYSVNIPSATTKCFLVKTPDNMKSVISGNFELITDTYPPDPLDVYVAKLDNPNEHLFSAKRETHGRFVVPAQGRYNFCIANGIRVSDGISRKVSFGIRVKPFYDDHEDSPGPMTENMLIVDMLIDKVVDDLVNLLDHVETMKERERLHRDVTEKTFQNVWRWAFFEKVVLAIVSVGQILYIKRFFLFKAGF